MSYLRQQQTSNEEYTAPNESVYSVAEYISLLNGQLKPLKATIQGEIGKINYYPRTVYFSLFDKDKTVLNCMVWPGRLQSLGIELKEGMEVTIQGYPDVYPATGTLQFKADVITPVGEGALKLAFERDCSKDTGLYSSCPRLMQGLQGSAHALRLGLLATCRAQCGP